MGELEPTPIPVDVRLIHTNVNFLFHASLKPRLLPVSRSIATCTIIVSAYFLTLKLFSLHAGWCDGVELDTEIQEEVCDHAVVQAYTISCGLHGQHSPVETRHDSVGRYSM